MGPLSGIRVVDFTHFAVGPWACELLGEMGADVVKIEPPEGDNMRRNPPPYKNGITTTYIAMNLNKWNTALDLRDEAVQETVRELVRHSDVLIENHRPGFLDRRGLSYEAVSRINPRMIYCSASGYGSSGPYSQMGSTDPYGQAVSGFASVSGPVGERPEAVRGAGLIDLTTSQYIAAGVLTALYHRERTGRGQFVDTSQMQTSVALSGARAVEYFVSGENPQPFGSGVANVVPSRAFLGSDKRYFTVSATDEATWQRLCRILGLTALVARPELQSNVGRIAHRAEIDQALEDLFATKPAEEWIGLLHAQQVPAALYLTFNNLRIHPQVRSQRLVEDVDSPWGRITVGGLPWKFSRTPGEIRATHLPGSDNAEILEKFAPPEDDTTPATPSPATPAATDVGGPLTGLRVIDLTQGYVGYCGMLFADLGADVVKVEPPEGDYLRRLGGPFAGEDSAAFLGVNRSKQSVRLAWATDATARAALDGLIATADVLISDLQPAEAARHGLNEASLAASHPRLVVTSLTPWGDEGPTADQPATELEVQATAWLRNIGRLGQHPVRVGVPIGGVHASLFAFQGTLAALYERARSGRGQKVAVSQLGSQMAMQTIMWAAESEPDEWIGHCLHKYDPPAVGYATADRPILWGFSYGADDKSALLTFCERLGLGPDIAENAWNVEKTRPVFEEAFRNHSADELVGWVRELGGNAVHYHTFESLARDPQAIALGLLGEYDYPGFGRVRTTGLAWEFSNAQPQYGRPPRLGEHTDQVLSALGLSAAETEALAHPPAASPN